MPGRSLKTFFFGIDGSESLTVVIVKDAIENRMERVVSSLAGNLEDMGRRRCLSGVMKLIEELRTEISGLVKFVEGL